MIFKPQSRAGYSFNDDELDLVVYLYSIFEQTPLRFVCILQMPIKCVGE